jgi:hypothetical protein
LPALLGTPKPPQQRQIVEEKNAALNSIKIRNKWREIMKDGWWTAGRRLGGSRIKPWLTVAIACTP